MQNLEYQLQRLIRCCVQCEQEFVRSDNRQIYCSPACRRKANNLTAKLRGKPRKVELKGPDLFAA